jgi:hydroxyacylglutathione hydrolase
MRIKPIPALKDNYIWMLVDAQSSTAWVVDPGEARGVLDTLKNFNLELKGILITHHHPDHCGGIAELLHAYPDISVYGSIHSDNPHINFRIGEGQSFSCFSLEGQVLEIPGHTLDHVAYYIEKALFCGDTLFSVGCGKVFEGTAQQMYESLSKLSRLPDDTKIYCGHEYTLANLKFAMLVDPGNKLLQQKLESATLALQTNGCTLPGLLEEEKKINPFLRCTAPEIIASVASHTGKRLANPVEVFHYLREWKNSL